MTRACLRHPSLLLLTVLSLLLTDVGAARAAETLRPLAPVQVVPIGRTATPYLVLDKEPVLVPVTGPGEITVFARIPMPADAATPHKGVLTLRGLDPRPRMEILEFRPSRTSTWHDGRPGAPSSGTRVSLTVPAGTHQLELSGQAVGGDPLLVILYFEGPPQPEVPGLQTLDTAPVLAARPKPKKPSPWDFRGSAGVDLQYNTNILTNSPEDMDEFLAGSAPYKYQITSNDDFVIAPSLELQVRRKLLDWGQTRFTFKTKRWMYVVNHIKTNHDFHFYLRQYLGKNQSLEGYFHFAPEQYIGQLSDRSPQDDPDGDLQYPEFRFQRNVWNLTWRQRVNRQLNLKLLYEENYRYYNQEFMENDIEAWELRLQASYRFNRAVTLLVDYSYEDADGRALDEIGETPGTSDNSDPSYERDLYRAELMLRPSKLRRFIDRIDLTFLFMDYYYTTDRSLAEDPYHAGRRDTYYKATLEVQRKLSSTVDLSGSVRRTQRVVYSPWEGDITTDKDFIQWLYWINLNYRF
jgi:hypothetical protein